jgi:hypothetical protein
MGDRPDMTQDQVKETPDYRRAKKELEFFNYLTNIGTHDNIVRPHMYLARNLHQHDHYWYFLLPLELCDTDLSRAMQAASQVCLLTTQRVANKLSILKVMLNLMHEQPQQLYECSIIDRWQCHTTELVNDCNMHCVLCTGGHTPA